MYADPILPRLVTSILMVLVVGLVLRRLRQPHVLAYLLAGMALGPYGLGIFTDSESISRLGDLGIILLLFFVGMEISLPRLAANWRIAAGGTLLQILLSVAAVWLIGLRLDWPLERVVLLGFVISLSSTGVALAMLKSWGHMDSQMGQDKILKIQNDAIRKI